MHLSGAEQAAKEGVMFEPKAPKGMPQGLNRLRKDPESRARFGKREFGRG
jgi:hypothetical protein